MADRSKLDRSISFVQPVLTSGQTVYRNQLACIDTSTGECTPGQASTTLIPIGYFDEALTGDGVKRVKVQLFDEVWTSAWDNDSDPNAVSEANLWSEVYIKDAHTVSTSSASSTRSKAGRVIAIDDIDGVFVQSGTAVTGPTGATGVGATIAVADRAALKALTAAQRANGMVVTVLSDRSQWCFVSTSTLTDDEADELVQAPDAGTGAWLRFDKAFVMKVPIAFGLADNADILTIPEGFVLRLGGLPYWETTVTWAGGTGSKIGITSSVTGATADGAILGGAAGDAPTAGIDAGTVGTGIDTEAEAQAFILVEGDTLIYNEITDAFTAGAGFVCLPVFVNSTAPATP